MSAALYSASQNNATLQGTTVGGSKPLHRFIKGQPKTIGVIVLILGSSMIIFSIAVYAHSYAFSTSRPPFIILGILLIICGILYIITHHNPTKKKVTISLALSIVTVLCTGWNLLHNTPHLLFQLLRHYDHEEFFTEEPIWISYFEHVEVSREFLILIHTLFGGVIVIVMSVFAGIALRSSKTQTLFVTVPAQAESPAEQQAQEDGLNSEIERREVL